MTLELTGFHHLTAVTSQIRENKRFFTSDLGMRLVKRTVNQDDTSAYHLFYADKVATPGNDVTFFDWSVPRERRGNHTVTRTALRVRDADSLTYWASRLSELKIENTGIVEIDGAPQIRFEDGEGQRLAFVADNGAGDPPTPWEKARSPPSIRSGAWVRSR
jgi:glyoxalase family protein